MTEAPILPMADWESLMSEDHTEWESEVILAQIASALTAIAYDLREIRATMSEKSGTEPRS